jgi:hypothetical protein
VRIIVEITIPEAVAASSQGMPRVCVRHGLPAEQYKRVTFRSRTPNWTYLLILIAVIAFAIVVAATQKRVKAVAWPFCNECAALRKRRFLTGAGLIALSVVGIVVLASTLPSDSSYGNYIVLAFVLALIVGLGYLARAGWPSIADGYASRDGSGVELADPSPAFAQAAAPAQERALPLQAWNGHQQAAQLQDTHAAGSRQQ